MDITKRKSPISSWLLIAVVTLSYLISVPSFAYQDTESDHKSLWIMNLPNNQKEPYLDCIIHGTRNSSCCVYLSKRNKNRAPVCSGEEILRAERLFYFSRCMKENGKRCHDHIRAEDLKQRPRS